MGILDDLKSQSEAQKAAAEKERQRQAELLAYYQKNIHPKMLQLYTFLNEFSEHLNFINKVATASFPIAPDGSAHDFSQANYKVTIDSTKSVKNLNLYFNCSLNKKLIFNIENKKRIQSYEDVLYSYRVAFDRTDTKDKNFELVSSIFKVTGPMPINIVFKADIENSSINMLLHNFEIPNVTKHIFKYHHITEKFLDGLGKYILRDNPDFFKLDIEEEHKKDIRKRVRIDSHKRQAELERAEYDFKKEEVLEKEKKSWKNIFKKKD